MARGRRRRVGLTEEQMREIERAEAAAALRKTTRRTKSLKRALAKDILVKALSTDKVKRALTQYNATFKGGGACRRDGYLRIGVPACASKPNADLVNQGTKLRRVATLMYAKRQGDIEAAEAAAEQRREWNEQVRARRLDSLRQRVRSGGGSSSGGSSSGGSSSGGSSSGAASGAAATNPRRSARIAAANPRRSKRIAATKKSSRNS